MAKKDAILSEGLNALFGGSTDEAPKAKKPATAPVQTATPTEEEELINSIDDEELRAMLKAKRMEGRGRPRTTRDSRGKRTDGYSRTTFILPDAKVAKIKEIGFLESLTMKEILEAALDMVIEKYESKHGEVIPRPERYKGDITKAF